MGKLQSVENALAAINEAKFQGLCDSYLAIRNQNFRVFSRRGSQSGKEKAIKGTPDSFLLLPDGNYIFVEYSTNVTAGAKKIEDDIGKCLDEKKTGVPKDRISEIIICLNFNIATKDIEALKKALEGTRIFLTVETLDSLALNIHLHHRNLSHEYLGLALDTGQVVSVDQFIQEYNRKGAAIATPLDNPFIERKSEQEKLLQAINSSDFVIATGSPGVGKSKLCIETIRSFLSEHLSYEAYCISYKSHTLLDDLYLYLDTDKDYVLFVDDANRIDAFSQITGFYQATRSGRLKVVVTVRDYAYTEVSFLTQEFDPVRINIERLTDEQIVKVIESKPFRILDPNYQDPIKHIADGNPRLAIMASLLAKQKQNPNALRDVSDLFEKYYATFIKDQDEFASDLNIKCLGLIAFFYTIPYKDKETITPILDHFNIPYDAFIDAIDELDKLELVEIQFEHVKIPEQNLNTYFFYKAFIQDQLLSFNILLFNYFQKNQGRFKDCVIPANNTFGYERVMRILRPFLKTYWNTVELDWEKGYKFFSTFWFYMQEETLTFVLRRVNQFPIPDVAEYPVQYETNDFSFHREDIINLLGDFLWFSSTMHDALEVLFEFVRRKPEHLPELVCEIRKTLLFNRDDSVEGFSRQYKLFRYLIEGVKKGDQLLTRAFFELAKTFLGFRFQHTRGGRNHSFVIYHYQIPDKQVVYEFRHLIWETIRIHFSEYKNWAFNVLENYSKMQPDVVKEIMERDLFNVLKIINQHLTPKDFEHCRYVQTQIWWCRRNDVEYESFPKLSQKFTNRLYERFLILNWDRLRDKENFELDDHDQYEKLKENQIRESVKFTSKSEIAQFYDDFLYLKASSRNSWSFNNVLSIVLDETFRNNEEFVYVFLDLITEKGNEVNFLPGKLFGVLMQTKSQAIRIWKVISKYEFKGQSEWKISFFLNMTEELRKEEHVQLIIQTIQEINSPVMISIGKFESFLNFDPNLFQKIIKTIFEKNEMEKTGITVWEDVFNEQFDKIGGDLELVEKFYIQQRRIQNHFDFDLKGLKRMLEEDSSFLVKYIEGLYVEEKHGFLDDHNELGFVWDFPDAESLIRQVFDLVRQRAWWFGNSEHYCSIFFKSLNGERLKRADRFLIEFVKANHTEPIKVSEVVDIVRHHRRPLFVTIIEVYVGLNQNVESFSTIKWIGSGGTYSGNTVVGDVRAADWKNILSIIEKANLGIKVLDIKEYIKEKMDRELSYANIERQRRFLKRY